MFNTISPWRDTPQNHTEVHLKPCWCLKLEQIRVDEKLEKFEALALLDGKQKPKIDLKIKNAIEKSFCPKVKYKVPTWSQRFLSSHESCTLMSLHTDSTHVSVS